MSMSYGKRQYLIGQGNEQAMIRLVLVLIHIKGGNPFIDDPAGLLGLLGYELINNQPVEFFMISRLSVLVGHLARGFFTTRRITGSTSMCRDPWMGRLHGSCATTIQSPTT